MEWWMVLLFNLAGSVAALYGLVVVAAWLGQRHLMYVPNPARVTPAAAGLRGVEEHQIATREGDRLVAWRTVARAGRPTLLYLHGNAGNLAGRADRFARYQDQGFGLLMLSWRGYSGSTGRPSEVRNVADALLAYEALVADGVQPHDIVVYGESLGSGVAVQLAAQRPIGAVVLDAPYTSIVDVALLSYPYLPVRPLLIDRYESDKHIKAVTAPVLIIHGERDSVIPVRMGRTLHAMAAGPKELVLFPDGGHVDLDQYGAAEIVGRWIDATLARRT
ncbi:MAG: alpha/beta hydrolase [Hyphomicrobiaceae bacterium]|nr:alpha/beta hydrolase [Hyphomicrobiaceae bacterium]